MINLELGYSSLESVHVINSLWEPLKFRLYHGPRTVVYYHKNIETITLCVCVCIYVFPITM